jgi:hypothetical protein
VDPQSSFSFHHVKGVTQEFDSLDIGCRGLFPVYLEKQSILDVRNDVCQRPLSTPLAFAKDDQIIGVANKWVTSLFEFLVQLN